MIFETSPDINRFVSSFKRKFIEVLLNVLVIIGFQALWFYSKYTHQYNLEFWLLVLGMFILFNTLTIVYFYADFVLISSIVTQFSINGDILSISTAKSNIPLLFNRPWSERDLIKHQFARYKTIFPICIFPSLKYPCWELRFADTTLYIINQFFVPEAITELEEFLCWKDV